MAKQSTPAQRFKRLFDHSNDEAATPAERETAQRKWSEWLRRHGKKPIDISSILAEAERDDAAAKPSATPPPDPRASGVHAFDDPRYNPAEVVEFVVGKYLTMKPHVRVIYALWIVFTHVYVKFRIAPRIALASEEPNAGKTTALDVARRLVFRPNDEAFGSVAAIKDFLDQGPGAVLLDELDLADVATRRALLQLWNLGHKRGEKISLKLAGKRKLVDVYAPVMAAGLGAFLGQAQTSRTFILRMEQYTAETKPECEFDDEDTEELDGVYRYLCHWAARVKLDLRPPVPSGMLARNADNWRGPLAIADACGGAWPQRARKAFATLFEEMKAELPKVVVLRHGLAIFERLGSDWIEIHHFNRELRGLDLPGVDWTRYQGASGLERHPRPISMNEQGRLLSSVGVMSHSQWPQGLPRGQRKPGDCKRIYRRADFEDALAMHRGDAAAGVAAAPRALQSAEPLAD
jgi:hypothetical protein